MKPTRTLSNEEYSTKREISNMMRGGFWACSPLEGSIIIIRRYAKERRKMKILIVYYSETGNTKRMAEAIGKGAEEAGGDVMVSQVDDVSPQLLKSAQAIILGSPCYFGNICWKMKKLIDETGGLLGELKDKVGGYFVSSGSKRDGEKTLYFLERALAIHQMRVERGILSVGSPSREILGECRRYGARIAQMEL